MTPWRLILARLIALPLPPIIAAHVSHRIYPHRRGWHDNFTFRTRSRTGSFFTGTTRDMHAHAFAIHGYFDWRLIAAARFLCKPGDTILEVGANVGTETIALADIVGPTGHVHAFEPEPTNFQQLAHMIAAAPLPQVTAVQSAVSDREGEVTFVPSPDERESGSGRIAEEKTAPQARIELNLTIPEPQETVPNSRLTVPCTTLDRYLPEATPVHLLVIDAEGAEIHILRGAQRLLKQQTPSIIIEANERSLANFSFNLTDLHSILAQHNYQIHELTRLGLTPLNLDSKHTRNWLALPKPRSPETPALKKHLLKSALLPCLRA